MTVRHVAYDEEQAHLDQTIRVIEKEIAQIKEEIKDPTDDYVRQVVNEMRAKELTYLETAQYKPYFGRIDFMNEENYETEKVYIGKRGVVESDTINSVVVDWRAPIAGLYYSGESKEAFYRTPEGIVQGEVRLKRNFAIEEGQIKGIFDGALKETINREVGDPDDFLGEGYIDEFLASHLNEANDSRLKDIVATIQAEQNDIIRAEKDRAIVVQGVAGSGKTTIALHRLSYLIYNYQHLASKKFIVFAPNKLFLTYISDVLPELGVEDVQQSTFLEWAVRLVKADLPKGWRILDPTKPLMLFFEHKPDKAREKEITYRRMHIKGSHAFRSALDAYMRYVIEERIPYKSLGFAYKKTNQSFAIPGKEIKQMFTVEFANLPYRKRMEAVRKHLRQLMSKQFYGYLRSMKIDLDKQALNKFEGQIEKVLENYLSTWPEVDVLASYRELLGDRERLRKLMPETVSDDVLADLSQSSLEMFEQDRVEAEDIAPLLYLRHLIAGLDEQAQFDHAVVDEAQDLSVMEITVVTLMTKNDSVTIVGDIAQGIHAYRGLTSWDEIMQHVFTRRGTDFYTLEQSYRSTIEIMRWSNHVLERAQLTGVTMSKPVLRHGEEPTLIKTDSREQMVADVVKQVEQLQQNHTFSSIAIVTKTIDESKKAHKALKGKLPDVTLLGVKDTQYPGGLTVIPAYLTKGLQFDVVIMLDVDEAHFVQADEMDAKLLYVAMTRPVHRLYLYYCTDKLTPLLAGVVT